MNTVQDLKKRIIQAGGQQIGAGDYGWAFLMPEKIVVKVTTDTEELNNTKKILNKKPITFAQRWNLEIYGSGYKVFGCYETELLREIPTSLMKWIKENQYQIEKFIYDDDLEAIPFNHPLYLFLKYLKKEMKLFGIEDIDITPNNFMMELTSNKLKMIDY